MTDEDGVDGPWEKAMKRAMREDRKAAKRRKQKPPRCAVCKREVEAVDRFGSCVNCGCHADRDPNLPW